MRKILRAVSAWRRCIMAAYTPVEIMTILRAVSAAVTIFGLLVMLGTVGALEHNMSMTIAQALQKIVLGKVLVVIGAFGMVVTYK